MMSGAMRSQAASLNTKRSITPKAASQKEASNLIWPQKESLESTRLSTALPLSLRKHAKLDSLATRDTSENPGEMRGIKPMRARIAFALGSIQARSRGPEIIWL